MISKTHCNFNRNTLTALGCETVPLVGGLHPFKDGAAELRATAAARAEAGLRPLAGVILATPANPTGAAFTAEQMADLVATARELGVRLISDETYQGLTYGDRSLDVSAVQYGGAPPASSADAEAFATGEWLPGGPIVVGSFSKYHSMTGWRVGWLVAPPELDGAVERLQQNLSICAPSLSQIAALAALTSAEASVELDARADAYSRSRAKVLATLKRIGVDESQVAPADGAFYVYADLSDALRARAARRSVQGETAPLDTETLCKALLTQTRVALTPGTDFEAPGAPEGLRRLRVSYAGPEADVAEALDRIEKWWML